MEDPFLQFSPFAQSENLILRHSVEVVVSFLMYHFVFGMWLAPTINRIAFGKHYTELEDKNTKLNFDIHTVSMLQCVVSLSLTWPILFQPLSLSLATYQNPYNSMVAAVTCGYFIWDLYVCLKHFSLFGIGFLGHALASLYVFVIALRPFCQSWVGKFLIFEASTPFVNVNWYISQLTRTSSKPVVPMWFNALNGVLLILTFFTVRIVWGFSAIVILIRKLWVESDVLPLWLPSTVVPLNLALNTLNVIWLNKMIRIAKKMAKGSKSGKSY
ncbi:LANO_0E05952g1_1 [Lachancea nothofagi CBS 11611]|uniref:LANO_0E05952g1_1 n=1 Tax=Lachancea nothofagi CBS 11611 TaxID=1266666 RepID=A0A1G4JTE9_9SACH|nr:LANO_0E05952g1_1 [Lachancea nothofagi CBS 11611]